MAAITEMEASADRSYRGEKQFASSSSSSSSSSRKKNEEKLGKERKAAATRVVVVVVVEEVDEVVEMEVVEMVVENIFLYDIENSMRKREMVEEKRVMWSGVCEVGLG
ncbi:hypothetical protein M0802_010394 [Mischocyttarus mexicanus]|nr:hypothetical protein M0802_010394 [Mischocyttarus mexicanus]